jgi:hypothetical protein
VNFAAPLAEVVFCNILMRERETDVSVHAFFVVWR